MDEHVYNYRFKVTQHSVENIKIVEIREFNHLIKVIVELCKRQEFGLSLA